MPLAPLPPETTPRLYIKYTSVGEGHTMIVRMGLTQTSADAVTRFNGVKTALAALLPSGDSISGADFSAAGSNIRFPLAVTGVAGTGAVLTDRKAVPNQSTVTGRSLDGRKVRIGFFWPGVDGSDEGWRITGASGTGASLWNILTGATLDARSISGGTVIWNNYVNNGANDHWVKEVRSNP